MTVDESTPRERGSLRALLLRGLRLPQLLVADVARELVAPWRRADPAPQEDSSGVVGLIADRQLRTVMETLPVVLATAGLGMFLLCLMLLSVAAGRSLWAWMCVNIVSYTPVVVEYVRFKRDPPTSGELRAGVRDFQRGASMSGCIWGSLAFVPMPPNMLPYVVIGELLVIATALLTLFAYHPLVVSFVVPCAVLTGAALIGQGSWQAVAAGLGFFVTVGVMLRLARSHNALHMRTMLVAEERKALVEELNAQRREAQRASVAKTFFLASVSHDLRQPMHSIALLVAAARRRGVAEAETIEQIGASVQAMDTLLSALLEVSKLDSGAVPLQIRTFPVAEVLQRVHAQFHPQAQAQGLRLDLVESPAWVRSDFFQLERVLCNLVANAIRYTQAGRVGVRCRQRGDTLWVQVWDTGIGIAREHRGRVYDEFYQVHRTPRQGKGGLGLGLSIVQRTAHRLNHGLRMRSRLGRGSLFEIGVPLLRDGGIDESTAQLAELVDGRLVLLVDDDPMALKSMVTLLKAFNCQVLSAVGMADALATVDDTLRLPDLIISDYRLADGHDGLNLIEQVRHRADEHIPAVLVTAEPQSVPSSAASAGVAVLAKPLHVQALASTLQRLAPT